MCVRCILLFTCRSVGRSLFLISCIQSIWLVCAYLSQFVLSEMSFGMNLFSPLGPNIQIGFRFFCNARISFEFFRRKKSVLAIENIRLIKIFVSSSKYLNVKFPVQFIKNYKRTNFWNCIFGSTAICLQCNAMFCVN